jgi:PP-loop superfamily ATP-utilizing enzyme
VDAEEMPHLLKVEKLNSIHERLTELGYRFVTLDLKGFRSGSLNPDLSQQRLS